MPEPINEIQQTVSELKGRIDEISTRQKKSSKKSWLDVLSSLSPLLSGVLIAAVGTAATIWYNGRQMHINHLNSLDKYRPYVTSENPVERVFGYRAFADLDEEEFVIELIAAKNDSAGINVLTTIVEKEEGKTSQKAESAANEIMASAISAEQQETPEPVLTTTKVSAKEGWAYLGHYVKSNNEWKTRYFDFGPDIKPSSFIKEWLKVREQTGALNIRVGMPTATGKFLKVIDVLKPGSEVMVHEVKEWYSTGYMWAKITYGK
jgi:hypothetical protein